MSTRESSSSVGGEVPVPTLDLLDSVTLISVAKAKDFSEKIAVRVLVTLGRFMKYERQIEERDRSFDDGLRVVKTLKDPGSHEISWVCSCAALLDFVAFLDEHQERLGHLSPVTKAMLCAFSDAQIERAAKQLDSLL